MKLLADQNLGTLQGQGPLGEVGSDLGLSLQRFSNVISTAVGIMTLSAGTWFIIQIFMGAFQWLSSGGDKQGVENARKRMTNATVGLFVVVAAYALISIVGRVFGLDILSPGQVFTQVTAP